MQSGTHSSRPGGQTEPGDERPPARFVVGIDLGTTNSAVAYVDTHLEPWTVRSLAVPQLVAPGQIEDRETLPSFHYEPAPEEFPAGSLRMAWHRDDPAWAVGLFARDQGTAVPGRLIASAKSWLCHSGVDRTAPLLPWQGAQDVTRLSPVTVSARILAHVRDAWNGRFGRFPLAEQDVVITLPASFDEVARELTVAAAAEAHLPRVVLIEEPQAAFYAWVHAHAGTWQSLVRPGQKILVCDVGGGTSDFTLIRVRQDADGKIQFHRVAVGDHLILGGDNLDLTLAARIEERLSGTSELTPRQWSVLVRSCRQLKESLLSDDAPSRVTVSLPGTGTKLIGGALQAEVTRREARRWLVDGFFPLVELDDSVQARQSGFQEFGLPFAPDPAVTRYLASFLRTHRHVTVPTDAAGDASAAAAADADSHDPARPDIVLFNGGLFTSDLVRRRLVENLRSWFRSEAEPDWEPTVLDGDRLDLAVARGAAYYGMVRRGEGVRIAAGLARTYYIGVAGARARTDSAVCLLPAGIEPGRQIDLAERQFDLLVSKPVEFPLFVSSTRLTDRPGELVPIDREQMTPLPPLRTVLRTRGPSKAAHVAARLHARLTEIGTIELWCDEVDGDRGWRLQFDVRGTTQTDHEAHSGTAETEGFLDESLWRPCEAILGGTFAPQGKEKPERLVKRLTRVLEMDRRDWPPSLLRRFWEMLLEWESGRRRSAVHEARWLNLLGFSLRPGYGLAMDDWRVAETWRVVQGKIAHGAAFCRLEGWILWRRIAGGLSAGQQRAVADPVLAPLRGLHRRMTTGRGKSGDLSFRSQESVEAWRLLGSLELLDVPTKIELGQIMLELLPKPKMKPVAGAIAWSLGRLGTREPLYGPLNVVVPVEVARVWLDRLTQLDVDPVAQSLAVMQLARRTSDRYRDLPAKTRDAVLDWLEAHGAPAHFQQLVRDGGRLDEEEQGRIFGEALPSGLRIA